MQESHPDARQQISEAKSLDELQWALSTMRKCQEVVYRNLNMGPDLEHTNLYLLTAILWLKEKIRDQTRTAERRFGDRTGSKDRDTTGTTPPSKSGVQEPGRP